MNPASPGPSVGDLDLRAVPRAERAILLRPQLDAARERVAAAHRAGAPGDETARAWALCVDEVVIALFRAALDEKTPPVALIAVGGYGRAELCPSSDLDLWFISDKAQHPEVSRLAHDVLYPLWDLKLDVGQAVRSPSDCVDLAHEDLKAATALLDVRFLDGEVRLFTTLAAEHQKRLSQREATRMVQRLVEEKSGRHARFGDTVYLLEPNLKNGAGGYRDLLVTLWAAKARFHVTDFEGLLTLGQATASQVEALVEARRFFLRVRTAAHLHARRQQDRLLFEIQEAIAPGLIAMMAASPAAAAPPTGGALDKVKPAVAPAVEALMQRYYLHAKAVRREGDRLLERCGAVTNRKPRIRKLDASFVLWNGQLSTAGPEVFRDRPAEMVRLFRVALETQTEVYGHTKELVAEACGQRHLADTQAALARDPAASRDFQALLADERDKRDPSLLEQMHDLGLLVALLPEFGPCTGRVQHDLYHVFTVDQHQLYAVARLKALARGDLAEQLPVASRAIKEVTRKLPLYLGTLLHDVGKPLGKGHSEKGARLAATICQRLRIVEEDQAQVEFLVRQHLVLAHLSQRRDLNDVGMIEKLAEQLGGIEGLRDLYLLTVADMSMVAPDNLTHWKAQLLRDLYVRTLAHYRRGPDLAGEDRSRRLEKRKARVLELFGAAPGAHARPASGAPALDEEQLVSWMAGLPDRYFVQTPPRTIVRHLLLSHTRRGPLALDVVHHPRKGYSEVTVVAEDAPGLLSKIAGVLLANRVDVLGAQIASRLGGRDAGGAELPAEAIDAFTVSDDHHRALDGSRGQRLKEDLERTISGAISVEALIEQRRERSSLPVRVTPHVATEVEIDEDVSADFTVLDVYTQDRPGVLYTITRTLSLLGHDIHLSKVSTEADRVADVFYVRDEEGRKLAPHQAHEAVTALHRALEELPAAGI